MIVQLKYALKRCGMKSKEGVVPHQGLTFQAKALTFCMSGKMGKTKL